MTSTTTELDHDVVNDSLPLESEREIEDGELGATGSGSQIANLVSMVFFKDERNAGASGRIIGVTAPIPGEGVTTVSSLMARELALADRFRSLLVSTEALEALHPEHLQDFEALWTRSASHGYWERSTVLYDPAAPKGPWNTDLMFRRRVIEALRHLFHNVLVECRPVRRSSDIALISTLIDGFIIVVRSGGSTRAQVQQAIRVIQLTAGEIKGCCFNRRTYPIPSRIYRLFKR